MPPNDRLSPSLQRAAAVPTTTAVDASVLEYFFNAAPDLFAILAPGGAVVRANMAFRRFVGPASGASDASLLSFLDESSRQVVSDVVGRLEPGGATERAELRFRIGRDDQLIAGEFSKADDDSVMFIGRDITAAQEQELERRSLDVNRAALEEMAGIGHWRLAEDHRAEWSPGLFRIYGLPLGRGPLEPGEFSEMVVEEDRERFRSAISDGFEKGEDFSCTCRVRRPDGQVRIVEIAGSPSRNAFGRIVALQGVSVDKTGDARALQEALETQSSVRSFMEASPMAVAMFDRDMRFLMVSDQWLSEGGWERDQLIGRRSVEVTPWLPDVWKNAHQKSLEGELCYADAERVELPGDRIAWIRWSSTAWRDASGAVAGTIFTKKDVTDLFQARGEVETSRERMSYGLNLSSMMIWELNYQTQTFDLEGDWRSFSATKPDYDFVVKRLWDLIHPSDVDEVRGKWRRHVTTGAPFECHHRLTNAAGRTIWVASTANVETDDEGQPIRAVGSIKDISETKRMALKAREAEARALEANAATSEFLARMSHEIRTPMNGVLAVADVLARSGLSDKQSDMAQLIKNSGKILLRLMDDLLEFARLDADQIEFDIRPFNLLETLDSVCASAATRARAKGLSFEKDLSSGLDGVFRGDAVRIEQVLSKLLSNAVKSTDEGGVSFSVDVDESFEGVAIATFRVSDTSAGFDAEQKSRLFDQTSSAVGQVDHDRGGLDLAIVKKLAELMKGDVIVSSEPGSGATFTVELPLTRDRIADLAPVAPIDAEDLAAEARFDNLSVLAAEDNPMNQRVLELILERANIRPTFVENGEDAVAAFKSGQYDVVLMDMKMPIMDGEAAARAIRAFEAENGLNRTPIIAVSANATPAHIEEAEAAGCDAHVAKPVKQEDLFDIIARVASSSAATKAA